MGKRHCTKDAIVESEDEHNIEDSDEWNHNQSNCDTDTSTDDSVHQTQVAKKQKKTNDAISNVSTEEDNLEAIDLNSTDFDPTNTLRISTKTKRSNHPIWNIFGILQKGGQIIAKAKDRIFCRKCFEDKKLKG